MKDLIIGDLHFDSKVGNKTSYFFINTIKEKIFELSSQCDRTIILGDLFKNAHPDNPTRNDMSHFLSKLKNVYIVLGNHDIDINGHVLLDLIPITKDLKIIDEYLETEDATFIAYNKDEARIQELLNKNRKQVVYGHFGIGEFIYNNYTLKSNLSYSVKTDYILGHIHQRQICSNVLYPGSVAPTNLSELQQDFGVLIREGNSAKFVNFDYGIKKLIVNDVKDLKGVDERTYLEIHLKELKEKHIYMSLLKDYLAVNFILENTIGHKRKIDLNMDFNLIVEEYLKMIGKTQLKEKIMKYLEEVK